MCMQHNSEVLMDGAYSLAIPLRALETFTNREDTEKILRGSSYKHLETIFIYLIKHKYFDQLRKLIDKKVPPLLEPTSIPATPISKCLVDMIKRPLDLISFLDQKDDFSMLVLQELCGSILCPRMSNPIRMFIIPSLSEFKEFPYIQLIDCINRMEIEPTISLLYSILSLESNRFCKYIKNKCDTIVVMKSKKVIGVITFFELQLHVNIKMLLLTIYKFLHLRVRR